MNKDTRACFCHNHLTKKELFLLKLLGISWYTKNPLR